MKQLLTIVALLISLASCGQDTLKLNAPQEFKRFLIGINISPDYCYRTLESTTGSSISNSIIDWRNESEEFKIGYTAGLNFCYNISKNFGIESGVQYSNKGFALSASNFTYAEMIDPRYGFTYPTNGTIGPKKVKFIDNYHYLDVPVRAIFSFGEKRISFVASIGVTTNILINATQTNVFEYENGDTKRNTVDQPNDYNPINLTPTFSVGIDYKISKKINLRVEPMFRYGLLKIIDTPVTAYLWNGGLNITGYYAIK